MEMIKIECIEENEAQEYPYHNDIDLDNSGIGEDKKRSDAALALQKIGQNHRNHGPFIEDVTNMSESFKEMGREAVHVQNMLESINPDLKIFTAHSANLSKDIETSKIENGPGVQRLICELELLKDHVAKTKSDILGMESSLSILLCVMDEAFNRPARACLHQDDTEQVSTPSESAGNMEDDLQHKILDCDPLTANVYEVEKDDTSYSDIDEGGSMPNGKESASYKHKQPSQKESKSVVCEVCGKILQSRKLLRTHEKREHHLHPSKRYRCLICNEAFSLCNDLHTHLATHSINDHEALKCKLCDVYLSASSSLISHLFEHHKKFACDVCGKKFLTTRSFQLHKKFHMEQFPCQVCNRVLRTASKLKDHMNRHTGEKPYECEVCHMRLPSISALENHKTRVHKEVGVKCLICEKTFKTTFARNSHYMEHTEEERNHHSIVVKMFTCEVCGKIVRDEYKATHLESHKSRHDRARVCEICGKEFLQLSWLKLHIKLHHKSGQGIVRSVAKEELVTEELLKYVCDICGKRFAYQSTLATHRVVHSDDRPYTCFCGKTFKLKGQLKQHEIIHTGNEPYKCDVCGKGFTIRGTYVSHMRTHSSEKPFACHVCGAKFNQRKNMVRHVSSVHDKERRFKCDVCGKGFNVKSSLQVHYRIHTGEKPYTCHICGHAFSDPSTFHKHKAIHAKKSSKAEVLANLAESNKDVMNS